MGARGPPGAGGGTLTRALVTGATGFVGANLARRLVGDGHEVHLLVRPGHREWRLEGMGAGVRLHLAGIDDLDGVRAALEASRPHWVFHLAAHGAYPAQTDARAMVATNVVGTLNLVEAALEQGFDAFVHTGSSSEYGPKDHPPAETERLDPDSHYGVTKASATLLCAHLARNRRAPLRTLRLYSVYGPWEEPTRLMPRLALAGLDGRLPPLADPRTARDYVYVDDVVDALLAAATAPDQEPGAVYNVGTGVQTSLEEVVGVARGVLGVAAEPAWGSMADRAWDTDTWLADNGRARTILGWEPAHTLEDGFGLLVDWLRNDPDRRRRYEVMAAAGGP